MLSITGQNPGSSCRQRFWKKKLASRSCHSMENLWAPWRMVFITPKPETPKKDECIFCTQPAAQEDEKYHIIYRGVSCFIMLNLYPYNNGHLMVAPYEHIGSISLLNATIMAELMSQVQLALSALRLAMNPHGFNM